MKTIDAGHHFAPHEPDLTGFSQAVKARFHETTRRTLKHGDYMVFLDGNLCATWIDKGRILDPYYIYHKIVKRRFGDAANSDTNHNEEK